MSGPMTYLCVPIFVTDDVAAAKAAMARAAEGGADMVELRMDSLSSAEALAPLLKDSPLPVTVTCRPTWEGGHSDLGDQQRWQLLQQAAQLGASYIDVELKSWRQEPAAPRDRRAGLILSAHDFSGRPEKLYNLLAQLSQSSADVHKVVWTARTIRDNLEALELLRTRQKPMIAFCMGEAGLVSRVLCRKFGGFLSFASLESGAGTAPGQVTLATMKSLYRWDKIGPGTRVYGVVAQPVAHSMSPAVHNAAFDATHHDGVYLPFLVEGSYESFKAFMESFLHFAGLDLSGLSITLPHKQNALRYLQDKGAQVEELSARIGAVNTIAIQRGDQEISLRGFNTDYAAILDCITGGLGISRRQLADLRVAVIGAGGTGRTAVAALAHYGATVEVYNRTPQRAQALADEFSQRPGQVVALPLTDLGSAQCDVYVNATSMGMHPRVDQSPFGDQPPALRPDTLVFDTVYNPMQTRLLQQARQAGARTVGGVEMFVHQAAAQFEAWCALPAPVDVMRQVIQQQLG
jgi:3-dehydroquinate dehydratase/shikimate dehydrogenase